MLCPTFGLGAQQAVQRATGVGFQFRHHRFRLDIGGHNQVHMVAADMNRMQSPALVEANILDRLQDDWSLLGIQPGRRGWKETTFVALKTATGS